MKSPLNITIASLDDLDTLVGTPFTKIISISDTHLEEERGYEHRIKRYFPGAIAVYSYFDDVDYPSETGPQNDEIGFLLDFSRRFTATDKILIHCRAGVSRSTAMAFAVICQHTEPGEEDKALAHIRELRPQLYPNRLIIAMADFKLNRKGRMISAASTKSKNGLRTGF